MNKGSWATIGPRTVIDFPKFGIASVPAKVDTGADASSIWASNVKERNGELSFTLFGKGSPFFTGEVIKTKSYKIRSIKNSFGVSELRYKVNLNIVVEKKPITVGFSLADRSDNQYPILIGRRTLHGRFLVDVSRSKHDRTYKVLVMDVKDSKSVTEFLKRVEASQKKLEIVHAKFEDLIFEIGSGLTTIRINGVKGEVSDFDFVYFKSLVDARETAIALARHLDSRGIPYVDSWPGSYPMLNKLTQYVVFNNEDIRVPKSLYMNWLTIKGSYKMATKTLGSPFVMKDTGESKGRNNYLIKTKKDFESALEASNENSHFIAQEYIENDGDYRILIFGKRVELVIHRFNESRKTHLNNTSMGGTATLLNEEALPGSIRKTAVKIADLADLEIAGVDMVKDKKTGLWYCLEVQHGPQITSGAFTKEKRQAFTKFLLRKVSGM